jgi:hypothetical protein
MIECIILKAGFCVNAHFLKVLLTLILSWKAGFGNLIERKYKGIVYGSRKYPIS